MSETLPSTERANPKTADLDCLEVGDLVALLIDDQREAAEAVRAQAGAIAAVVARVTERLRAGGTLHYVGAGTSGRLGALDAAEMVPTFGTAPGVVRAHVAGGDAALTQAVEGAEDDGRAGAAAMERCVAAGDAVVGISAGGGAPFVVAALERARAIGAYTAALSGVEGAPIVRAAEASIVLATGPEALTGSTRLKAGTAQKIALNALSTAVMVRLGKVHGNLMVDLVVSNRKLRGRAIRLVCSVAGIDERRASELLDAAHGRVKIAVIMARRGVSPAQAEALLAGGVPLRSLL